MAFVVINACSTGCDSDGPAWYNKFVIENTSYGLGWTIIKNDDTRIMLRIRPPMDLVGPQKIRWYQK